MTAPHAEDLRDRHITRRGLMEGAVIFATLLLLTPSSLAAQSESAGVLDTGALENLSRFADAIIPPTDTPGATGAGVVDYIADLFRAVPVAEQGAFTAGLAALDAAVSRQQGGIEQQLRELLGAPAGQSDPVAATFLRQFRRLVMIGYYTSETGGSQELIYAPVPGAYLPDIPVTPQTRAFSNDTGALL